MHKVISISDINPKTFLQKVEEVLNNKLECDVTFINSNIAYIIYKEVEHERIESGTIVLSTGDNTRDKKPRKSRKVAK